MLGYLIIITPSQLKIPLNEMTLLEFNKFQITISLSLIIVC